jgi:hypothetical protein
MLAGIAGRLQNEILMLCVMWQFRGGRRGSASKQVGCQLFSVIHRDD